MPVSVEVRWIGENRAWVPTLARWHVAAFADAPGGWQVEQAEFELRGHCARRGSPTTLVALEAAELLGSVSLLDSDPPAPNVHAPWLSALFVVPEKRGQGLGALLCRAAVAEAARLGVSALHLWTRGHGDFYHRLGWQSLGLRCFDGVEVSLMRFNVEPQE